MTVGWLSVGLLLSIGLLAEATKAATTGSVGESINASVLEVTIDL